MTTGATGQLGLALPVQGELSGTWGDTVNNGITQYTNIAIAGTLTLTGDGAVTLANTTGDASASNITSTLAGAGTVTAQFAIVKVSGTTTTKVVTGPSYSKTYVVDNASSFAVTFKASGQTGVSVAAAEKVTVVFNGTDYIKLAGTIANAAGSNTQIQFNNGGLFGASANLTWDGTYLTAGSIKDSALTSGRVTFAGASGLLTDDADLTFDGTTLSTAGLTASGSVTLSGGTANGVTYLNGSKVLTSGSALTFDGTNFGVGGGYLLATKSASGSAAIQSYFQNAGSTSGTEAAIRMVAGTTATDVFGASEISSIRGSAGVSSLKFSISNGTTVSEAMRLTSTGLGIGTSSPSELLTVGAGTASVNSVFYLNGGSDSAKGAGIKLAKAGTAFGYIGAASWMEGGTSNNLAFSATSAATLQMRLDSAGNLGLGVTPSAWNSVYKGFQIGLGASVFGRTATSTAAITSNAFVNSAGNFQYINTEAASYYLQGSGQHFWTIAPSGTAGDAISFTQAMTLDASGNLLVGSTSATYSSSGRGLLEVNGSSNCLIALKRAGSPSAYLYATSTEFQINNTEATPLTFHVNGSERARITSAGDVGIGTSSPSVTLSVNGTIGIFGGSLNGSIGSPQLYRPASDTLAIATGATERARIDSSGNLLVGTTSSSASSADYFLYNKSGAFGTFAHANGTPTGTGYVTFLYNATQIGSITQSGTTAVAYNTSSDYRLKNTIAPMTGALAKVAQLKPCTYKWNIDGSDGEGFIAHELAEVVPQCVTGEKDAVDADGNPKYQGIDVSFLVATLTAAIQEQQAIIESLKARLDAANL